MTGPWRDPRAALVRLASALTADPPVEWRLAVLELAEVRADTAAALWFGEQVIAFETPMDTLRHQAADSSWADQLAIGLAGAARVGVTSMGPSTRRVVETLATVSAEDFTVVSRSAVVIRGLEDLGIDVVTGDPATTDACLIPVAATTTGALWTSPAGATAHDTTANPVVLADPVTDLGAWAASRFRPAEWMVRLERPPGI